MILCFYSMRCIYLQVGARHGPISLATLPVVAARHFPLCAQHLMAQLHSQHHLRHQGRQQLGLFLKVRLHGNRPYTL